MKKKDGMSLSLLSASSGLICVGSPVSLCSQTAVEVSAAAAVRCLPPPSYSLTLNLNILKVNTLKFTHTDFNKKARFVGFSVNHWNAK